MAYGTPADPVAGTVITVAYAITNILDPIRALRSFMGGSDPPGSNYVVTSDSVSATSWKTTAAMVLAALGYTPVNKAGDSGIGTLQLGSTRLLQFLGEAATKIDLANGFYTLAVGANTLELQTDRDVAFRNRAAAAGVYALLFNTSTGLLSLAALAATGTITATGAISSASTISATGVISSSANVSGSRLVSTIATGTPPLQVASNTEVSNLNANFLEGHAASYFEGLISTGFPSGVGGWVRQASEIPSGFSRETNLDGRIPVGAGTTFSTTFNELTNYGSSWSFTVSGSATGLSLGGPAPTHNFNLSTPGTDAVSQSDHGHAVTTNPTFSVGVTWTIPSRGVVWIRKN